MTSELMEWVRIIFTVGVGIMVADLVLIRFESKRAARAILKMPETQSIQRALKHFENFMAALDEFGKSEEMKQLAKDLGTLYQKVGVMFGLPQEPKKEGWVKYGEEDKPYA